MLQRKRVLISFVLLISFFGTPVYKAVFADGGDLIAIEDQNRSQSEVEVNDGLVETSLYTTTTTTTVVTISEGAEVAMQARRGTSYQVATTTLPWNGAWTGDIPAHYGGDTGCTREEADLVAFEFRQLGASDDTILWALGMISRESTCDSAAHNGNRNTGDDSWGLCQINALAGHFGQNGIVSEYDRYRFATDFAHNASACAKLWSRCGRGPWNYGDYYCKQPTS